MKSYRLEVQLGLFSLQSQQFSTQEIRIIEHVLKIKLKVNNFSILGRHEWITASCNKVGTLASLENSIEKQIEMV
jgi:hypothetical protein